MTRIPDIPRFYTALAEWSACALYISLWPLRHSLPKTLLICAGAFALQCLLLVPTGGLTGGLWILCMSAAVGLMFLLLRHCCKASLIDVGFCCIRAFLLAEFSASLEWQMYYYFCQTASLDASRHPVIEALFLLVIYTLILAIMRLLEQRNAGFSSLHMTMNELYTALLIGVGAFALSNVSFLNTNTPFSGQSNADIFYIRTLVDLAGVASLYAFHIQRIENYTRYELSAMNTLLETQYQQYCISSESVELVNRKYHDLKHQIEALRNERSASRRNEWLDEIERDIRQYEAANKTGNNVLDTLITGKSLYCQKNDITLTCVADGTSLDFVKVMDICAIFGNALDNAIESTIQVPEKEQRLIHVAVCTQKSFVLIRIENYFGGTLEFEDGIPKTTKTDQSYHGFGIKSIKSTVESYDGSMTISTENGWFELKILLPIPAPES